MVRRLPHLLQLVFVPSIATASSSMMSSSLAFPAFAHPRNHAPPSSSRRTPNRFLTPSTLASKPSPTIEQIKAESEQLRKEIQELRAEALRRLRALEDVLSADESSSSTDPAPPPPPTVLPKTQTTGIHDSSTTEQKRVQKSMETLLENTIWNVSLNIGREPGTWMPPSWGSNPHQRLHLSFLVRFAPSPLYERDDFLRGGGYSHAKTVLLPRKEAVLGPSLTHGQKVYRVENTGGWQVVRGEGPMGTDLLRFYIELDEEVRHGDDGDLYVPKGRVYCSCGYFPFGEEKKDGPSVKESYEEELRSVEERMERLREKRAEIANPWSLEGFRITREMGKLRREAESVGEELNYVSVREPERSLLKFSREGDVGLTREGGVCCRVEKGPMVVEYHILGRFSIACADSSDAAR